MKKKEKTRIELIDVAKAITIFLVIMGHAGSNFSVPLYRRVLYSFHMPLFFFLAGLSIKPILLNSWEGWRKFLKKNILALIVPYFIWGLIYSPFSFAIFPKLFYGSWTAIASTGTLSSLWFLTAFFVARIITQAAVSFSFRFENSKRRSFYMISAVAVFVIGFLFPYLEQGYPWCLDVAFVASGFILLGIALRETILIVAQQKGIVLGLIFVVSLAIFLCSTLLRADSLTLMRMCAAEYGNLFWFFVSSLSGMAAVMSLSMLFIRIAREGIRPFSYKAITYIGAHTMGIFLLHKNMLQDLIIPLLSKIIPDIEFLKVLLGSFIDLVIAVLLCTVIERYIPQLLGQFPKYEDQKEA